MPYNSETETFYQAPATVVDSTPDGDTVQEGFDDRLTPALAGVYADFNLLKADGMISVGIPATTTARGIGRVATSDDLVDGATINNGPAFLASGVHTSVAAAAGKVPVADNNGKLDAWVSQQTQFTTCATAAATAAKEAPLTGFSLVKGARVFVIFANSNTVAGALSLNVNDTGAKAIYNELGAVSATNPATFPAGIPIEFIYNGTNWTYRKYQDEFAKTVGGAPMYSCRAWVAFNGTGTPTIIGSGNVSSIGDINTGCFRINFSRSMPDANYSLVCANSPAFGTGDGFIEINVDAAGTEIRPGVNGCTLRVIRTAGGFMDPKYVNVMVMR